MADEYGVGMGLSQRGRAAAADDDADVLFETFLRSCRSALKRISAHSRGEYQLSDVEGEAWLLAEELRLERAIVPEFGCVEYQQKIISYLYQKLVRYSELNVRHAIRLDHAPGDALKDGAHPLLAKLAAAEQFEPLAALLEREAATSDGNDEPAAYESPAAAYLQLLQRFDNRMLDLANHLLISRSWCYNRVNAALRLATTQWPLPKEAFAAAGGLEPRTWRKFRVLRYCRRHEPGGQNPLPILAWPAECG